MAIGFGTPAALLLLLGVPVAIWAARGKLPGLERRQRRLALAIRGAIFASLILAMADAQLGRPDDRLSVVLAVDTSASIQEPQQLLQQEWLQQASGLARPDDQVTVVKFARWASSDLAGAADEVARADASRGAQADAAPPADATNLADALDLGETVLGTAGRRRIVLLTDGQQNVGRAQEVAARLATDGVEISFVRPEPRLQLADVLVRSLDAPAYVREGETVQLDALVASTHRTEATLRLFLDNRQVGEQQVDLQAGVQRIPLVARRAELGFRTLRVEVEASEDSVTSNNAAEAYTIVKPAGRVLVLENQSGEAAQLDEALRASGLRTQIQQAGSIPPSAAPLLGYDSIVLVNVPATALSLDQQTTLQSYVQDYGRGLLVVGGNTSYSLGAYADSPLGNMLPVDPVPPARRELGSIALFLVIDKSASMDLFRSDVSKIAMSRQAAILAVEALNPGDQVAVMTFDTRYQWIVPLTRLQGPADVAAVKASIATIRADGGTSIYPALEAAYQQAMAAQARLKHIVLLTDGQDTAEGYIQLISRMKPQNITLTTIGVGSDTDVKLLTRMAQLADGRFYFTERAQEIPRIVSRETTIVSRSPIVEGAIRPQVAEPSPLLADLQGQELPQLAGYVATGTRQQAHTVLVSDRGDPLLAHWQYGLGRVVAWTSDARTRWASSWLGSPDASRAWGQAVRWSMPPPTDPAFMLTSAVNGDRVTLQVEAHETDGRFAERRTVRATAVTPDGQAYQLPMPQVGPGTYQAVAQAPGPGTYAVRVEELRDSAVVRSETGGFVITPATELRTERPNRPLLEQLAQSTGGRELVEPRDAFRRDLTWAETRWTALWPWLLGLALLLLPFDVAARRLSLFRR